MRAATAIEIEDVGEIPVPFSINTRTNATICKATKKKIVGGSSSKNSFLSVVDSLVMKLNCDKSFSVSWFLFLRLVRTDASCALQDRRDQVIDKRRAALVSRPP